MQETKEKKLQKKYLDIFRLHYVLMVKYFEVKKNQMRHVLKTNVSFDLLISLIEKSHFLRA